MSRVAIDNPAVWDSESPRPPRYMYKYQNRMHTESHGLVNIAECALSVLSLISATAVTSGASAIYIRSSKVPPSTPPAGLLLNIQSGTIAATVISSHSNAMRRGLEDLGLLRHAID